MSSKKYKKTTNNLKLNNTCIFIIIGFLLTFLFGEFTIKQEYQMILKTYLSLFLIGLSTFPMTYKINNFFKGMVIIILDRFMDTIALVTVILLSLGVTGGHLTQFIYFLFIFLLLLIPIYAAFPGIYQFWRKWLLKSNASIKKLCVLRVLDTLKKVYVEVENVIKGRGMILYFLSLIAWGGEIGCLILLNGYTQSEGLIQSISTYLTTAMNGGQSAGLRRFSFASIIMMIIWYLGMKMYDVLKRKRKCK